MEVRCCCNPGKLLGYIPDPPNPGNLGFKKVPTVDGKKVEVEVAWLGSIYTGHPAVKSNDLPIEFYENIRGWIPADVPVSRLPNLPRE